MALQSNNSGLTGSLGNISYYKMRGVEKTIVRTKGGPTKHQVDTYESFQKTRNNNSEFAGRSIAGKWIRDTLDILAPLANYNISASLISQLKPAQEYDTVHEKGQRSVLLSQNPRLLEGFSFNKEVLFDSIVRNRIFVQLNRETLSARLDIPALVPGLNLFIPGNYAAFGLVAVLGIIPDFHYEGLKGSLRYLFPIGFNPAEMVWEMDWHPCSKGSPAAMVDIRIPVELPKDPFSLVLGIGIRFGTIGDNNSIVQVKRAGAAKILAMG